jgi:hypothetical protein
VGHKAAKARDLSHCGEQFEAYGKRLSEMPVFADIPFDSGGFPEIFEVHKLRKR